MKTRICKICNQKLELNPDNFSCLNEERQWYLGKCKSCISKVSKIYYRDNKEEKLKKQREHYINTHEQSKKLKRENKSFIRKRNYYFLFEYKKDKLCKDCGNSFHPCAMDFDHINSKLKTNNVSELSSSGAAIEVIMEEIAKCELVCANCHRIRTFKRNQYKSFK